MYPYGVQRLSHIMLYVDGKSKLAKIALIPCNLLGDKVRLKHASLYQKGKGRCLGRNDLAESAPMSGRVSSNGRCGLSRFDTRLVSHT